MTTTHEMQREIRHAIGMAYELLRYEHVLHEECVADALCDLESELFRIEAKLGGPRAVEIFPSHLDSRIVELEWMIEGASEVIGSQIGALIGSVREIQRRLAALVPSREIRSRPLGGVLPLARVVPADVHALRDYAAGTAALATALVGEDSTARLASAAIGATLVGVSLVTDQRLAATRRIPIETHHAIDIALGVACVAAPFVFGYARTARKTALFHVVLGLSSIAAGLFTDYRAAVGVGRDR